MEIRKSLYTAIAAVGIGSLGGCLGSGTTASDVALAGPRYVQNVALGTGSGVGQGVYREGHSIVTGVIEEAQSLSGVGSSLREGNGKAALDHAWDFTIENPINFIFETGQNVWVGGDGIVRGLTAQEPIVKYGLPQGLDQFRE